MTLTEYASKLQIPTPYSPWSGKRSTHSSPRYVLYVGILAHVLQWLETLHAHLHVSLQMRCVEDATNPAAHTYTVHTIDLCFMHHGCQQHEA